MNRKDITDKFRENVGGIILIAVVGSIATASAFVTDALRHYDPGHQQLYVKAAYCSTLEAEGGNDPKILPFVRQKVTIPDGSYQGWTCGRIMETRDALQE